MPDLPLDALPAALGGRLRGGAVFPVARMVDLVVGDRASPGPAMVGGRNAPLCVRAKRRGRPAPGVAMVPGSTGSG